MATKTATKAAAKPATKAAKKAVTAPAAKKASAATPATKTIAVKKATAPGANKPLKDTFTKASLVAHLVETSNVEPKQVKAVIAALEDTMLGAVHKKGAGEFMLSGLLKVNVTQVPAKKKRFGKDPFTGEDRWFDAKPATVRLKIRPLKKLKDAAL
jgi:nucleoid DNA-binding protein